MDDKQDRAILLFTGQKVGTLYAIEAALWMSLIGLLKQSRDLSLMGVAKQLEETPQFQQLQREFQQLLKSTQPPSSPENGKPGESA